MFSIYPNFESVNYWEPNYAIKIKSDTLLGALCKEKKSIAK